MKPPISAAWFAVCALAIVGAYIALRWASHAVWQSAFGAADVGRLEHRAVVGGLVFVGMVIVAIWSAAKGRRHR